MIRFCVALASVAFWPDLPAPIWLLAMLIVFLLLNTVDLLRPLLPVVLGLWWGIASGHWLLLHQLPEDWQGVDLIAVGTVVGLPEQRGDSCRFDLALDQLINTTSGKDPFWQPRRLRLTWYRCLQLPEPSERWQLSVRLKRPHGFVNPGGFNYPLHLFSQGIDASGYIRNGRQDSAPQQLDDAVLTGQIDRWRAGQLKALQRLPLSPQVQSLLAALLVGDKRGLDDATWQTLRDTGTAHLFVISGLHIGMLASVCFGLVYAVGRLFPEIRYRYRVNAAAICAILGAGGYALLSGWGIPSQRAWIMVCAVMLSMIGFRQMTPTQRLWLAATAVLLIEPLAVRQPGFWLSFMACAVLIYAFAGVLEKRRYVRPLLWAQVAIAIGLTPGLLFLFYQWPPLAPLINIVAIPLVTLLLPIALVAMLSMSVWSLLATTLFSVLAQLLEWGWQALVWSQQLVSPLAMMAPTPLWAVVMALVGAMLLLLPRAVAGRWMGALMWLPLLFPQTTGIEKGALKLTMLDVGQGLAVLVETQHHRLLYDTGPRFRSGFNAAEAAVIPFLYSQGIRQLDRLLISHADSDHAGGQAELESGLEIGATLSSSATIEAQQRCRTGEAWRWDGVDFVVLHPDYQEPYSGYSQSENNRSCVLQIDNGQHRILLTGDIEAEVERLLVSRYGNALRSETLLASHHGSRSSSTEEFLDQVQPQQFLISSGRGNRFGHPDPEVVSRVEHRQIDIFNTAQQGAIQLQISAAGDVNSSTAQNNLWGYWHRKN